MILLNFSQKLHDIQFEQIDSLASIKITEQIVLPIETSTEEDMHKRLDMMFAKVKLTDEELKKDRLIILPPPHAITALKVIGDLYQRTGSFPLVIRLALPMFGLTTRPAVMEILDLQEMFKK
jgi:hypothetical protein